MVREIDLVTEGNTTFPRLLRYWAQTTPDKLALREKDIGIWNRYSWAHYYNTVRAFALGLQALGFTEGDRLAIASEDTPEWMYSDLGAQSIKGEVVGIYPTNPWPELKYIVAHSRCRFIVCGDQEQFDKVQDALNDGDGLPHLEWIICVDMKGMRHYRNDRLISFADVVATGEQHILENPGALDTFERTVDEGDPDQVCMLVYTSGTTGPPKGAMLSHRNLIDPSHEICREFGMDAKNFTVVCYLPLCHVAERIYSMAMHLITGGEVNFAESVDTIAINLREIAPTVMLGVPRIWEKLQQNILIGIRDATPFQQRLFEICLRLGYGISARRSKNDGKTGLADRALFFLLWLVMFRSLQRFLGLNRTRQRFCGGASVSPETLRFFDVLGLPVFQVYGMTEVGGVAFMQKPGSCEIGCVGVPHPGVDSRIEADGELLLKSRGVFKGYLDDPEATAKTITDGWLHTGDVVEYHPGGELMVVDRKKAIIITSGGKNIAPSEIENALKDSLYIREAIIIGDGRHFLSALIQIDYETVGKWAQGQHLAYTTYTSLAALQEVRDLVAVEVKRVNALFARVENVREFRILKKELDHDDGELTATQKVRRSTIEKKFSEEILSIYGKGT